MAMVSFLILGVKDEARSNRSYRPPSIFQNPSPPGW